MWTRSRSVRETFVRMAEDFFHEPAAASALVAASAFLFSRRGEWTSGQAVRAALNLSGQFELVRPGSASGLFPPGQGGRRREAPPPRTSIMILDSIVKRH